MDTKVLAKDLFYDLDRAGILSAGQQSGSILAGVVVDENNRFSGSSRHSHPGCPIAERVPGPFFRSVGGSLEPEKGDDPGGCGHRSRHIWIDRSFLEWEHSNLACDVIMFIRALGSTFHWPAMRASTTLMVPEKHLARISGLNEGLGGLMNIVSPPLGALLLEALPMQQVLSIDILTAILAILPLLLSTIPQPTVKLKEAAITRKQLLKDVSEGIRYMVQWTGLFIITIMAAVVNFLINPAFTLSPLLVTQYFKGGIWHLSVIESVFSIGVVAGGFLLGFWGGFKRQIMTALMSVTGMGIGILVITFAPPESFFLAVIGMAITGFMNPITNGPIFFHYASPCDSRNAGQGFYRVEQPGLSHVSSWHAGSSPCGGKIRNKNLVSSGRYEFHLTGNYWSADSLGCPYWG